MTTPKIKNIFVQGAIDPAFIATDIANHSTKHSIGGHSIFLGQIRADQVAGHQVVAIEYTAYEEMANQQMAEIREMIFEKYNITCMHIYHSLGKVNVGELCLFVFVSSVHRKAAIDACTEVVESIKSSLPIWGKEILDNADHQWKMNN